MTWLNPWWVLQREPTRLRLLGRIQAIDHADAMRKAAAQFNLGDIATRDDLLLRREAEFLDCRR
jgi:hypothetical protein